MIQPALFDVDRTTTARCKVCDATRMPGENKARDCNYDLERSINGVAWHRPKGCLNAHDPAHAPFPQGF